MVAHFAKRVNEFARLWQSTRNCTARRRNYTGNGIWPSFASARQASFRQSKRFGDMPGWLNSSGSFARIRRLTRDKRKSKPGGARIEKQLEPSLRKAIAALEQNGCRYSLIEGVAVSQWVFLVRPTMSISKYSCPIPIMPVCTQQYWRHFQNRRGSKPPRSPFIVA